MKKTVFITFLLLSIVCFFVSSAETKLTRVDMVQDTDLGVTKTGPDTTIPGASVTYTITVTNSGPDSADNATLNDPLPAGTTFVSLVSPAGWSCTNPSVGAVGTVTCTNASLGFSSGEVFTLVVIVDNPLPAGTFISNKATISSSTPDTNDENDSSTSSALVIGTSSDLGVTKSNNADTLPADSDVTYTITVTNGGPDTAANVALNDSLPGSMAFVSLSSPAGWSCTTPAVGSSGAVSCTIPSLTVASGAQVFTLVGHIPAGTADGTVYSSSATVSTTSTDPTPENNDSASGVVVGCLTNPVVTTNADSGPGSLRRAIQDACVGGTITFDMTQVTSPIALTSAELLINKDLTIQGPGANLLTVMRSAAGGTPNFRIFNISPSHTVAISGLTISNGNVTAGTALGGGIYNNQSDLTINDSVISGNSASAGGGIFNDKSGTSATLTINNSTVGGNQTSNAGNPGGSGGGIGNTGTLTVTNTTVSGNHTGNGIAGSAGGDGGGIYNFGGTLTVRNTTVSGNVTGDGNGVGHGGYGGGISNTGTLTMTNSTISGNQTGGPNGVPGIGGGVYNSGTANVTNTTVTDNQTGASGSSGFIGYGNGGGILNAGTTSIKNTIVANNRIAASASGKDISGTFNSLDYNLIGDISSGGSLTGTTTHNLVNVNARLAALANNGGPTQTLALLPGSPAIDAGDNCVTDAAHCSDPNISQLTTDQRGFARQVNGTVDIGAFESRGFTISATSGTPQSTVFSTAFGAPLLATVSSAFGEPVNGGQVTFTAPGSGASATFTGGVTTINVAINASGQASASATANATVGGPYNVAATGNGITGTANFSLTNLKGNQTITFGALANKTFGDPDFAVSATASSGLPVSFAASGNCTVTSPSPGTVHITGAGSCTITASQAGDSNYNPAANVPQSFTINKANQTITFAALANKTFGDPDFAVSATSDSGLAVSFAASGNCTVSVATVHITGAGSCTITASQGGNANYNPATDVQRSFNIAKTATSTSVSSSVNPSDLGQSVTFTATVTSTAGTPTGTVQFKDGGTNLGSPQTLNGSGVATFSTSSLVAGVHTITADYSGDANFLVSTGTLSGGQQVGSIISFSSALYNTTESSRSATITVQRSGGLSSTVSVDYATPDDSSATPTILPCSTPGFVSSRCDFTTAIGTLKFGAGETSKTFDVLISQDNYVEGPESLTLTLSNVSGNAGLGSPSSATLTIADDVVEPATNPIDDPQNFVRQHYHDFLNREPDAAGLQFWTNEITSCGANAQCIEVKRTNVSAAFFLAIEFQATGGTAYLTNKVAFGGLPNYLRFETDAQALGRNYVFGQAGAEAILEANKVVFFNEYVSRTEFMNAYNGVSDRTYVNTLIANTGVAFTQAERDALLNGLTDHTETRATVLRKISEKPSFAQNEFTTMFVLMEYFGYLRRNPDAAGFNFWLNKLNSFNGNFIQAEMVKAFINSGEYRQRFGQ